DRLALLGSKIALLGCELLGCSSPPHVMFWCRHRFNRRSKPDPTPAEGCTDDRVTIQKRRRAATGSGNGSKVAEHHPSQGKQSQRVCAGRTGGSVNWSHHGDEPVQVTAWYGNAESKPGGFETCKNHCHWHLPNYMILNGS